MSLAHHEDFAIYQLRRSYLSSLHDGVGERLISLNTTFLNDPAFRAAGWTASPAELKRTYSPPIPTTGASDYFQAPPTSSGLAITGVPEDEEEGGMVTGRNSDDTVGPALLARRRRRREDLEEDDSSDLSDESEDDFEQAPKAATSQVKFEQMPLRERAGSSPLRKEKRTEDLDAILAAPSRPPEYPRLRRGSLGAVEAVKQRERRDTTTSSEVSSENELDPSVFQRKQILMRSPIKPGGTLTSQMKEPKSDAGSLPQATILEEEHKEAEDDSDSDNSSLASGFSDTVNSTPMFPGISDGISSPPLNHMKPPRLDSLVTALPSKRNDSEPMQELPPPRPISTVQPVSALAAAIKAKKSRMANPFERFADLAGKEGAGVLYIKLYIPHAKDMDDPAEVIIKQFASDGSPVTVAETIGFGLWQCGNQKLEPAISGAKANVNWWTLRIVEDEEIDYDFPALDRAKPITDFTSNNNRPIRGRARSKPWDEFALVEAKEAQFRENETITPAYSQEAAALTSAIVEDDEEDANSTPQATTQGSQRAARLAQLRQNPITDPMFINAGLRKDSSTAMDMPLMPLAHAQPRTGLPKTLNIHFTDHNAIGNVTQIDVTTDTYLAEVFDQICKKLNLDKALYVLRVTGTSTVAPPDRTVEALGETRSSLDLTRRRFITDGNFGLSGSPGSTSPNAPLLLTTTGTPKKQRKGTMGGLHPLAQPAAGSLNQLMGTMSMNGNYKRYHVIRKQPMSFTPSHQRVLALDDEYLHIMPGGDVGREKMSEATGQSKTASFHFSNVIGCKVSRKHPKSFRVVVWRERESKRYDFEASSVAEAAEIVLEIKKGVEPFKDLVK